jgi:hypothetical protein
MDTNYQAQTRQVAPTRTAQGLLEQYTDRNTNYLQRVGQQARDRAASRGLENSSISVGAAQGAVVDQLRDVAIRDSELYQNADRDNQNAVNQSRRDNATNNTNIQVNTDNNRNALQVARENNTSATQRTRIETENRTLIQNLSDRAQAGRLETQVSSNERISSLDRQAQNERLTEQLTSQEGIAQADRDAQNARLTEQLTSQEGIASADREAVNSRQLIDIASREGIADADRENALQRLREEIVSRESISGLDRDSRERIAEREIEVNLTNARLERENRLRLQELGDEAAARRDEDRISHEARLNENRSYDQAYQDYQNAVGNIDPNAPREAQQSQFRRVSDTFRARMGFLDILYQDPAEASIQGPIAPSSSPRPNLVLPNSVRNRESSSAQYILPNGDTGGGGNIDRQLR